MDSASTAAVFLAVIALSDGLRLLPGGAIVISRLAFGNWNVATQLDGGGDSRLRLITWCSPVFLPLVLSTQPDAPLPLRRSLTRFRSRRRRVGPHVVALRITGVLTLLALIAGIPFLTARSGLWGFLLGASTTLWLCVVQALLAYAAFRRIGATRGRALLASAKFCWPFTAPRAAEAVMHRVADGVPPLVLLHELLPTDAFVAFARPLLFDSLVRGERSPDIATLRAHLGESASARIVRQPPAVRDGDAYCPRCGASFYRTATRCSDCAEVDLVAQPAG